jgi:hypothetical protein
MTKVRVLMVIAASQNWPLLLDVNTAFWHGDLTKEVYMKPPPGLHVTHPDLVCKLQRPLIIWLEAGQQTMEHQVINWNPYFLRLHTVQGDYSLFTKHTNHGFTITLVYVDDLVLGGTDTYRWNSSNQATSWQEI